MQVSRILVAAVIALMSATSAGAEEIVCFKGSTVGWRLGCSDEVNCFVTMPIDITRAPRNIFDIARECVSDETCRAALIAAAAAYSVPKEQTEKGLTQYELAYSLFAQERGGNEQLVRFRAPRGYRVCNLYWDIWDLKGGDRIGMSGSFSPTRQRVSFFTNVPLPENVVPFDDDSAFLKAIVQIHVVAVGSYPPASDCAAGYYKNAEKEDVIFDTSNQWGQAFPQQRGGRHALPNHCK